MVTGDRDLFHVAHTQQGILAPRCVCEGFCSTRGRHALLTLLDHDGGKEKYGDEQ